MSPRALAAALLATLAAGGAASGCAPCDQRTRAAESEIFSALSDYKTCTVDDDCARIDPSTSCRAACYEAVSDEGFAEVQDAIDEAQAAHCADYPSDCGYAAPDCPAAQAACEDGRCVMVTE